MLQCHFCLSKTKSNYIYAECTHFICTQCASIKWDRKYSFKCCNKMTFLEEETCNTLSKMNNIQQIRKGESKQNYTPDITQSNSIKIIKDEPPLRNNRQVQQSIYISQLQQASPKKAVMQKSEDAQLVEMQSIMSQKIYKVKVNFEAYKQELQRREQMLLKQIYDTYSDHLSTLKNTVTEQDTTNLRHRLDKLINQQVGTSLRQTESKPDKILNKLEYNQTKMKQKLNRHYELLK